MILYASNDLTNDGVMLLVVYNTQSGRALDSRSLQGGIRA